MIPETLLKDTDALKERGFVFQIIEDGPKIYLRFNDFPLPSGCYNLAKTDLLIFTSVHYPHAGFDMFWTDQGLTLSDGSIPKQADSIETHLGGKLEEVQLPSIPKLFLESRRGRRCKISGICAAKTTERQLKDVDRRISRRFV